MPRYATLERFPGYRFTSDGRVQSRIVRGSNACRLGKEWVDLKYSPMPGRRHVRVNLKGKSYYVHALILEAFKGPCPPGMECLHRNGDGADNRLSNLRWGTRLENVQDAARHGTLPKGENHWTRRVTPERMRQIRQDRKVVLTAEQVREIRSLVASGRRQTEVAALFGVHQGTISKIVHRRKRKDIE